MGSDKIFMFDNPAAGESAGIMSMIPALLQNKGIVFNAIVITSRYFVTNPSTISNISTYLNITAKTVTDK